MKSAWAIFASLALLLVIATGGYFAWKWKAAQSQTKAPIEKAVAPAEISVAAHLQAKSVIEISAPVSGKIEAFHAEVGTDVYQGQLLAQVRSETLQGAKESATLDLESAKTKISNLEASLAAARLEASRASADAARARTDVERTSRVLERQKVQIAAGAIPKKAFEKTQQEFTQAESEAKGLEAVAEQAEARAANIQRDYDSTRKTLDAKEAELEHTEAQIASGDVYSPVDGVVASRKGQPGDDVNPAMKDLFQIATELSTMEAVAEVTPQQMQFLRPGQQAFIAVAEAPGDLLTGIVKSLDNGHLVVEFSNPNPLVRPGLTAQIRVIVGAPQAR